MHLQTTFHNGNAIKGSMMFLLIACTLISVTLCMKISRDGGDFGKELIVSYPQVDFRDFYVQHLVEDFPFIVPCRLSFDLGMKVGLNDEINGNSKFFSFKFNHYDPTYLEMVNSTLLDVFSLMIKPLDNFTINDETMVKFVYQINKVYNVDKSTLMINMFTPTTTTTHDNLMKQIKFIQQVTNEELTCWIALKDLSMMENDGSISLKIFIHMNTIKTKIYTLNQNIQVSSNQVQMIHATGMEMKYTLPISQNSEDVSYSVQRYSMNELLTRYYSSFCFNNQVYTFIDMLQWKSTLELNADIDIYYFFKNFNYGWEEQVTREVLFKNVFGQLITNLDPQTLKSFVQVSGRPLVEMNSVKSTSLPYMLKTKFKLQEETNLWIGTPKSDMKTIVTSYKKHNFRTVTIGDLKLFKISINFESSLDRFYLYFKLLSENSSAIVKFARFNDEQQPIDQICGVEGLNFYETKIISTSNTYHLISKFEEDNNSTQLINIFVGCLTETSCMFDLLMGPESSNPDAQFSMIKDGSDDLVIMDLPVDSKLLVISIVLGCVILACITVIAILTSALLYMCRMNYNNKRTTMLVENNDLDMTINSSDNKYYKKLNLN